MKLRAIIPPTTPAPEARNDSHLRKLIVTELRGFNLACWCPVGKPCHADVLLKIANGF